MKLGMDLGLATAGSSVQVLRLVISFELLRRDKEGSPRPRKRSDLCKWRPGTTQKIRLANWVRMPPDSK